MGEKISILVIDDHPLFREGLKSIIGRNPRFEVAGEAGNGEQAAKMVRSLKPQLATMDISLPDGSGIELIRTLLKIHPGLRIMVVSMHSKIDYIINSFQAGATGYLVKVSATEKLLGGIEAILKGEYFMDTSVSKEVVKKLIGTDMKKVKFHDSTYDSLTAREQEIMTMVAEGLSSQEISKKLFISPKTVENHRSSIMSKLELHSKIDLVRYAARLGLIDVDLWKE